MEFLRIVAASWPIAVMFIAICVSGIVLYVIKQSERWRREDKAYRASQAVVVRQSDSAG